jgi:DNA replication protein DnaC
MPQLAERTREKSWSHERFLEGGDLTEIASLESDRGDARIKAACFPWEDPRGVGLDLRTLGQEAGDRAPPPAGLPSRGNVVLLGPSGTSESRLASAISVRACVAGSASSSPPPPNGVGRLDERKAPGTFEAELRRLRFIPLIVVDEVRYIRLDREVRQRDVQPHLALTNEHPWSAISKSPSRHGRGRG